MLGQDLVRAARAKSLEVVALTRAELDVTDQAAVTGAITRLRPAIVIQCAAYTRVDDAEVDPSAAFEVNAGGALNVALACAEIGARFVYPSTDYVFDGSAREPYRPAASASPINVYGKSKLAGEQAAREAGDYLVVRTSWLYGSGGRNFVKTVLEKIRTGQTMRVVDDQYGSPTWSAELADKLTVLITTAAPPSLYHLCNTGITTWYELALETVRLSGLEARIERCRTEDYPTLAPRPRYSVLDCSESEKIVGATAHWRSALASAIRLGSFDRTNTD